MGSYRLFLCKKKNNIENGFVSFNNHIISLQLVEGRLEKSNLVSIRLQQVDTAESLFHEFLHWYHWLRDAERLVKEENNSDVPLKIDQGIGELYFKWTRISDSARRLATVPWLSEKNKTVHLEEVRTILGSSADDPNYLEGDDLSENTFRLSIQYPRMQIRFGHSTFPYEAYFASVKKAISSAYSSLLSHIPSLNVAPLNVPRIKILQIPEKIRPIIEEEERYPDNIHSVAKIVRP
ncbi:MAG: hypothetical protein LBF57_00935 [Holosporaceae bacterium]|jgi:hypothetical protein|nr:hypothetical protein [Holosporaceae bacterium]